MLTLVTVRQVCPFLTAILKKAWTGLTGSVRHPVGSGTVKAPGVKARVGNALTKLGAQNRTHAVVIAYEADLVVPGVTG